MSIWFRVIMIVLMVTGVCISLFWIIRYFIRLNKFTDYLFRINDRDTLRKIGRMDSEGNRILATVPFTTVHRKLEEKYKETNDEEYLKFDDFFMEYIEQSFTLGVILFLLISVYFMIWG